MKSSHFQGGHIRTGRQFMGRIPELGHLPARSSGSLGDVIKLTVEMPNHRTIDRNSWMARAVPLVAEFMGQYPDQLEGVYYQVEGSNLEVIVLNNFREFNFSFIEAVARLESKLNEALSEFEYVEVRAIPQVAITSLEVAALQRLEAFSANGQ